MATDSQPDDLTIRRIDGDDDESGPLGRFVDAATVTTPDGPTLAVVLTNERAATEDEAHVAGAIAYDLRLEIVDDAGDATRHLGVTYTAGPAVADPANAERALHSIAMDASAAEVIQAPGAPAPSDGLDLDDPDVRQALDEYADVYDSPSISDAIRGYRISVKARDAFHAAGLDAGAVARATE